ncbi:MAG: class I mannose-6-phosphate isomerase [Gemmatimonadota bacterium]|nr:class I mannose-6-phosphate isomerase [Gemmatimonadota bacterium]
MLPNVLPLEPYFREMIWGGRRLQEEYDKALPPGRLYGESWEVSAYPGMESIVAAGPLYGRSLRSLVESQGRGLLGEVVFDRYGGEFPLLVKLLDAQQDLSIQVHPDDAYARMKRPGEFGKMEAWYVLRSENGRIACGLKPGIDRSEFVDAIDNNRVSDAVEFYHARPGDVAFIPPGTVHALCAGVMVYEVQQSSDITFRIFDYNRPGADGKPRELHIDDALAVIDFDGPRRKPVASSTLPSTSPGRTVLVESEHFRLERFNPSGNKVDHPPRTSVSAVTFIHGSAGIRGGDDAFHGRIGGTFLVPAGRDFAVIRRDNSPAEYLVASIP